MSNLIQNGDFASGGANWTNPAGGLAFTIGLGVATGISDPDRAVPVWTYKMYQQFSSGDEIITATITVWAAWEAYSDDVDGYNQFVVELEKPDTTMVTLVNTTKTAVTGSGNILSASNIAAHMATYGNYKLWFTLRTKSAGELFNGPPRTSIQSQGWYDNISIDVTVKKYKTVHEILGSSGAILSEAKVTKSEIVGLSEAYSTEVFSPVFNYQTASESAGLNESYSTILKRIHGEVEVVGLVEAIQAKRTQGNLETTYILEDLTQWTEISVVETPWVKEKIEIIGG
jgi:hypothetical protein